MQQGLHPAWAAQPASAAPAARPLGHQQALRPPRLLARTAAGRCCRRATTCRRHAGARRIVLWSQSLYSSSRLVQPPAGWAQEGRASHVRCGAAAHRLAPAHPRRTCGLSGSGLSDNLHPAIIASTSNLLRASCRTSVRGCGRAVEGVAAAAVGLLRAWPRRRAAPDSPPTSRLLPTACAASGRHRV